MLHIKYLLGKEGEVGHLEDEVGPDDVEDEEDGEEAVEDVVGGKHGHQLGGLYSSTGPTFTRGRNP